ncbi:hypothetical protein EXS91_05635 [Helicobacter pylori]|nr:hypothetical protein [Helicobacter pylori]WRG57744.1 hypothetical protein E5E17_02280 [Helicobacter pylori]
MDLTLILESATTQINANKQEVLNNITQEKQQATLIIKSQKTKPKALKRLTKLKRTLTTK